MKLPPDFGLIPAGLASAPSPTPRKRRRPSSMCASTRRIASRASPRRQSRAPITSNARRGPRRVDATARRTPPPALPSRPRGSANARARRSIHREPATSAPTSAPPARSSRLLSRSVLPTGATFNRSSAPRRDRLAPGRSSRASRSARTFSTGLSADAEEARRGFHLDAGLAARAIFRGRGRARHGVAANANAERAVRTSSRASGVAFAVVDGDAHGAAVRGAGRARGAPRHADELRRAREDAERSGSTRKPSSRGMFSKCTSWGCGVSFCRRRWRVLTPPARASANLRTGTSSGRPRRSARGGVAAEGGTDAHGGRHRVLGGVHAGVDAGRADGDVLLVVHRGRGGARPEARARQRRHQGGRRPGTVGISESCRGAVRDDADDRRDQVSREVSRADDARACRSRAMWRRRVRFGRRASRAVRARDANARRATDGNEKNAEGGSSLP